jgi:hypothetical protein
VLFFLTSDSTDALNANLGGTVLRHAAFENLANLKCRNYADIVDGKRENKTLKFKEIRTCTHAEWLYGLTKKKADGGL